MPLLPKNKCLGGAAGEEEGCNGVGAKEGEMGEGSISTGRGTGESSDTKESALVAASVTDFLTTFFECRKFGLNRDLDFLYFFDFVFFGLVQKFKKNVT